MYKRIIALVLLAAFLCVVPAQAETVKFAVIYDGQDGPSTERNGAVEFLREYVLYAAWQCDFLDAWASPELDGYDAYVLCLQEAQELPADVAEGLLASGRQVFVVGGGGLEQLSPAAVYRKGDVLLRLDTETGEISETLLSLPGLWMLPGEDSTPLGGQAVVDGVPYALCQQAGNIAHLAYFDGDNALLCALLADCLQLWQWPYDNEPTAYGQYLVLENAYPFLDPQALMDRADMLRNEGVPFVIAVTGIYDNADHPSMKRYCEVLRYEQSRGTGIILRVPFVAIDQVGLEPLLDHMNIAYEAYAAYGVYPVAIQAPKAWLQSEKGLDALRGFRTLFLFESEETLLDPVLVENAAYRDGHQVIAPAWNNHSAFSASYAQAVYLDTMMDLDEMRTLVRRLKTSHRVFKNLKEMDNAVYLGDYAVLSNGDGLTVNGRTADLSYTPFTYEEDFEFDRGFMQYMKNEIEASNDLLIVFVVVACTLFTIMMILFRRQAKRDLILGKKEKNRKQTGNKRFERAESPSQDP